MDNRAEVREFLMTRRARVTPDAAGIPAGPTAASPGLRRSEVAALAGVSVEYYSKLERGAIAGASASVLDAVSRALQLDDTERAHLLDLARAADGIPTSGRPRRRAGKPAATAAQPAVGAVVDHRRRRVRPRSAPEPPRRQRPRSGVLLARHRRRRAHAQPGPVPVPRPGRTRLLPRLGPVRRDVRRRHARRSRPRPARQGPAGPRRRTLDCAARHSARSGRRTTCAPTGPARSASSIPSSAS